MGSTYLVDHPRAALTLKAGGAGDGLQPLAQPLEVKWAHPCPMIVSTHSDRLPSGLPSFSST